MTAPTPTPTTPDVPDERLAGDRAADVVHGRGRRHGLGGVCLAVLLLIAWQVVGQHPSLPRTG